MNSKLKIVTKIEELNHSNENSRTKKAAIHNTTVRLGEFFRRNGEASAWKVCYTAEEDRLRSYVCREGMSENRNRK
jgi:hypothetical protein